MPYPVGQPFNNLFDPRRFDLIYGRATARGRYFNHLPRGKKREMAEAFVTLDEYNNTLELSGGYQFTTPGDAQRFQNVVSDRVNLQYPTGLTGPSGQNQSAELNRYATAYMQSRHSPSSITARNDQDLESEGFTDRQRNITWKVIRSSCKFGIEYVVLHSPADRRLHFVLDDINDHDIIVKTVFPGYGGQLAAPITTSELRSVYRRWNEYKGKVLFYRNFTCVLPPWETNPAWDQYGLTRVNKYMLKLTAAKQANPGGYAGQSAMVNHCVGLASNLSDFGQYNDAVGVLKHAITLVTGPVVPPIVVAIAGDVGASKRTLAAHVKDVIDDYDAQKGFFRRKSKDSKNASTRLRQLLNDPVNLARAVRHYLDLDRTAAAQVPNGLTTKLSSSSTMFTMLMTSYKNWLGVRESVDLDFF